MGREPCPSPTGTSSSLPTLEAVEHGRHGADHVTPEEARLLVLERGARPRPVRGLKVDESADAAPSVAPICGPEDVRPVRHRRRSGQVAAEDQRRATILFHLAFEREADLECHLSRGEMVRTNDCDQMLNPGVPSSIPHCRGRCRGIPLMAQFGQSLRSAGTSMVQRWKRSRSLARRTAATVR